MTKEIGPREKAAREVREAAFIENQKRMKAEAKASTGGLDEARLARSKRLLAEAEAKAIKPKRYHGSKRDQRKKTRNRRRTNA